jgi:2-oxoisovalerate dehydrogenase E2 component (dihydrolipoyl transacylase)
MAQRVFSMPDLGEGLESGEVVAWLVSEGDTVALNQPLVEVETEKAAVEIPSPFAGRVVALHAAEGASVVVGAPLVTFGVADGEVGGGGAAAPPPTQSPPNPRSATTADRQPSGGALPAPGAAPQRTGSPAKGTPPVRRLAKELGVDLGSIEGSGQDGRVTAEDVRRVAGLDLTSEQPSAPVGEVAHPARRVIAEILTRQAAIPQVTTFRTVDCLELERFRGELGVSPLPVVIAALCRALADHPMLNARLTDGRPIERAEVNVGIATDTEHGLVVPVVHEAHALGIAELASEIRRVAEGARSGSLAPADLAGATIAVSNTGSYGSEAGTPILSPGTSVTLAIGVIAPRALVVDGEVVARPTCTLSCTFDHRLLDGAAVGRALSDLVAILQDAVRLEDLPR